MHFGKWENYALNYLKFLRDYFYGIEHSTAPRTQVAYAIDLKSFFEYIKQNNSIYRNTELHDY